MFEHILFNYLSEFFLHQGFNAEEKLYLQSSSAQQSTPDKKLVKLDKEEGEPSTQQSG